MAVCFAAVMGMRKASAAGDLMSSAGGSGVDKSSFAAPTRRFCSSRSFLIAALAAVAACRGTLARLKGTSGVPKAASSMQSLPCNRYNAWCQGTSCAADALSVLCCKRLRLDKCGCTTISILVFWLSLRRVKEKEHRHECMRHLQMLDTCGTSNHIACNCH